MKRLVALLVAFQVMSPPLLSAETLRVGGVPVKQALETGILRAAVEQVPQVQEKREEPSRRRSIWRTPWPYLAIGGGIAVAAIAASGGYGSGNSSGSGTGGDNGDGPAGGY